MKREGVLVDNLWEYVWSEEQWPGAVWIFPACWARVQCLRFLRRSLRIVSAYGSKEAARESGL